MKYISPASIYLFLVYYMLDGQVHQMMNVMYDLFYFATQFCDILRLFVKFRRFSPLAITLASIF